MRKIPIKIYVNFSTGEVITAEEYEEKVNEGTQDYLENHNTFCDFLEEKYCYYELFTMTDDEKNKVKEYFEDYCRDTWLENDAGEWEEHTVYVSIPRDHLYH